VLGIYLYIELFAARTMMTNGTNDDITSKTAAIVKTRFLCITTPFTVILFKVISVSAGISRQATFSTSEGL